MRARPWRFVTDNDDKLDELARRFHAGEELPRPPVAGQSAQPAAPTGAQQLSGTRAPPLSGTPAPLTGAREPPLDDTVDMDELRGTLLARKLARRRGYGVTGSEPKMRARLSSWALALIALLSSWSLWGLAPELRYWAGAGPALDIGRLGAYAALDALPDGALVRLEGIASPKRGTYSRLLRDHEVFPLIGSRLLIDRVGAPDPALRGYGFSYRGEGRLSRAAARYQGVRDQFVQAGELARSGEVWVLEDGVVPRRGLRIPLEALLWSAFALSALATLVRRLVQRS